MFRTIAVAVVSSLSLAYILASGMAVAAPRAVKAGMVVATTPSGAYIMPALRVTPSKVCKARTLEQGGSPTASTVKVCEFTK